MESINQAMMSKLKRALFGRKMHSVTQMGKLWFVQCSDGVLYVADEKRALIYPGYHYGLELRFKKLYKRYTLPGKVELLPGDVVIDVGANCGEFSIAASRKQAMCVSVEADPLVWECLERNARRSSLIHPVNVLLAEKPGISTFYLVPESASSSLIKPKAAAEEVKISAVTLDGLCSDLGIAPTFLKMDAEGAEPEVLSGAQHALAALRCVAIDCGPERQGKRTINEVRGILQSAKFNIRSFDSGIRRDILFGWKNSKR